MDFEKLDIEQGFVLAQGDALRYLKWVASNYVSEAIDNPYELDYENASEAIKDVMLMGRKITSEDWVWVKFECSPMSASEINVKEMAEKQ